MLVSAVGAGLLVGLAMRGSLRNLATTPVRMTAMFAAGVALRLLALGPFGSDVQRTLFVLSVCALIVVSLTNLRLVGAPVIALGLALNAFVIATAGGAMPVASEAVLRSGTRPPADALHVVSDNVSPLADVIPVGPLGVYSVGDLILAVGTAMLIAGSMRTPQ